MTPKLRFPEFGDAGGEEEHLSASIALVSGAHLSSTRSVPRVSGLVQTRLYPEIAARPEFLQANDPPVESARYSDLTGQS
jgi:hypothetical protein